MRPYRVELSIARTTDPGMPYQKETTDRKAGIVFASTGAKAASLAEQYFLCQNTDDCRICICSEPSVFDKTDGFFVDFTLTEDMEIKPEEPQTLRLLMNSMASYACECEVPAGLSVPEAVSYAEKYLDIRELPAIPSTIELIAAEEKLIGGEFR